MWHWLKGVWSGTDRLATGVVQGVLVILFAVLLYRVLRGAIRRAFAHSRVRLRYLDKRYADTLASTLTSLLRYVMIFLAVAILLQNFGINISTLIAAAGIGGVALAFGAQNLVKDVVTGFFLLFEGQLAVGDLVTVAEVTGQVVEVGLRVTRIRDAEGRLYTIPNGQIARVANLSDTTTIGRVNVPVGGRTDLARLEQEIRRVCGQFAEQHDGLLRPPTLVGLLAEENGLCLRVSFQAVAEQKYSLELELRRALYLAVTGAGFRWKTR